MNRGKLPVKYLKSRVNETDENIFIIHFQFVPDVQLKGDKSFFPDIVFFVDWIIEYAFPFQVGHFEPVEPGLYVKSLDPDLQLIPNHLIDRTVVELECFRSHLRLYPFSFVNVRVEPASIAAGFIPHHTDSPRLWWMDVNLRSIQPERVMVVAAAYLNATVARPAFKHLSIQVLSIEQADPALSFRIF
jgi:hypothetical protein